MPRSDAGQRGIVLGDSLVLKRAPPTENMSGEKTTGSCNKFQPNIFNKSKCQNCFKSREVHPLNDSDLEQAKPIYAGWLCLAPVGTDFDNPVQRSRKWQRRFFILYENGSLTYALDELLSTLPQGTVNMNLCTNLTDAEPRTGQRNALCIVTPAQDIFIRGENKEIINSWSEQLTVYLRTNKQNQKKKRKVDPVANQDPSPAKMAATGQSCPASEGGSSDPHHWQEELNATGPDVTPTWTVSSADPPGPEWTPAGNPPCPPCQAPRGSLTSDGAGRWHSSASAPDLAGAARYDQPAESMQNQRRDRSRDPSAEQQESNRESTGTEQKGAAVASRQGRTNARTPSREKLLSAGDGNTLNVPAPQRRAKSLDRRTSDMAMTPDLLNFKKGWMMKLDEDDEEWKKYWFVLSMTSLRYYKDSLAEESSNLEGEIDLTKCYSVSEYRVQRNYGFQIHTQRSVYTLSAMTAGIRRNWIQALMKNVHPAKAPDVTDLPGRHIPSSPPEVIPKPDVTQDSATNNVPAIKDHPPKSRSVLERQNEAENQATANTDYSPELGDLERRRRREERRKRYESLLGFPLGKGETQKAEDGAVKALSPKSQRKMEEKIAECWRQVESSRLRPERTVMLSAEDRDTLEVEKQLQGCRKVVDELKSQLADSERHRLQLEAQLRAAGLCLKQQDPSILSEAVFLPADLHLKPLTDINGLDRLCQREPHAKSPSLGSDCDSQQFLVPEKPEGRDIRESPVATDQSVMKRLSQEVELLTSQNQALNQRNQEMVNQLTEADREIERLKVELGSRYTEPHHLPEVEQQEKMKLEDLERQLSLRNQELLEAQMLITSLEENLKETEALLQLKNTAETNRLAEEENKHRAEKAELLQRLDATEAKVMELQRQLEESELTRRQLENHNMELKETGELYLQRASEAEADIRRLAEEKAEEEEEDRSRIVPAEEKIQQVIEGAVMRQKALRTLLQLIESFDFNGEPEEEEGSAGMVMQLRWEETFWRSLLDKLRDDRPQLKNPIGELLCEVVEGLMLEDQMVLEGLQLLLHPEEMRGREAGTCESKALDDGNFIWESSAPSETRTEEGSCRSGFKDLLKNLEAVTQTKISSLHLLASSSSSGSSSALDRLLPAADRLYDFYSSPHPASVSFIHSAATQAFCCCLLRRLQSKYERRRCSSCVSLTEENEELKTRLSILEEASVSDSPRMSTGCQTDERSSTFTDTELQSSGERDVEETSDMELTESEIPLTALQTVAASEERDEEEAGRQSQRLSELKLKVEELEEQLRVSGEKLREDSEEKMRNLQEQHEREIEKLKATCERGLVAMEDCHERVVEELQRLHQQEVERLLLERERLLEEESSATATAIEAIMNAHREELQREIQRTQAENSDGNIQLEEIHRQHR
ncbi:PREDICTED: myosin phosphatase Rho-interacting protein-like isoform X1 [Cyprinodon variegatus]|uniref:myosin phosphatase Rho-interacting protein-like isoform X1 n=1 Tax=Cyprinodon variegatus TaxID=28743 RepID=UPI00074283FD|nr:PREDICTED: myosin phosphatase Rho-interacting protein-like isoform X1 [Cyprinodon variegatus]